MNKHQENLEKMIALTLIGYVVGILFGEAVRDFTYGHVGLNQIQMVLLGSRPRKENQQRKWHLYSGLFVLLKQNPRLSDKELSQISTAVLQIVPLLVFGNVRTLV